MRLMQRDLTPAEIGGSKNQKLRTEPSSLTYHIFLVILTAPGGLTVKNGDRVAPR